MPTDRLELRPGAVLLLEDLAPDLRSDLLDCARPGNDATDAVEYVLAAHPVDADEAAVRGHLASLGAWDPGDLDDPERNLRRLVWVLAGELRANGLFALEAAPLPDIRIVRQGRETLASVIAMRLSGAHYVGQLHRPTPSDPWTFDGDLEIAAADRGLAWRAIRAAMAAEDLVIDPESEREVLDSLP